MKIFKKLLLVLTLAFALAVAVGCEPIEQDPVATTYDVTFDSMDADVPAEPEVVAVEEGQTIAEMPSDPIQEGYEFVGWFADDEFEVPFTIDTVVEGDMTVYAKFIEFDDGLVSVYFAAYGADVQANPQTIRVEPGTTLDEFPTPPQKEYYDFVAWYTNQTYQVEFTLDTVVNEDIIVFAMFEPATVAVYFAAYGADVQADPQTIYVTVGETIDALPAPPEKDGYTFEGWYVSQTFQTEFTVDTVVNSNMIVFAKFAEIIIPLAAEVESAINYEYDPVYEVVADWSYDEATVTFTGQYTEQEFEESGPVADLARYLGALYRQAGSTITEIHFEGTVYTWNELEPLIGSNWEHEGTTLVSAMTTKWLTDELPLVITLTDGLNTLDVTFIIEVEFSTTVQYALNQPLGEDVLVRGVVTSYLAFSGAQGFFMQDPDGAAIFVTSDHPVQIGDEIVISGELGVYDSFGNYRLQINSSTLVHNYEGDNTVFVIDDKSWVDIGEDFLDYFSMRFVIQNAEIVGLDAGFFHIKLMEGEDVIELRFHTGSYGQHLRTMYDEGIIGDGFIIPWMEFTVYDLYFNDVRVEGVVLPELTELDIETLALLELDIPENTTTNITLPDELEVEGVNYDLGAQIFEITDWSSNNINVITNDGIVIRPEHGEGDATVELTATIKYNETTNVSVVFTVVVPQMPAPGEPEATLIYYTGFEDATAKGSYATGTMTADGIDWELSQALRGNLAADKMIGDWTVRGRADGYAQILTSFEGLAIIEFMFAHYGTLTAGELSVEISVDGGITWIEVWTMTPGTYSTLELVEIELDYLALGVSESDQFMVQWVFGGPEGNDSRMNIDEIKLYTME